MDIAVLGGSFDPPHNGHLHVAKMLLKNKSSTSFSRLIDSHEKKHRFFEKVLDKKCEKVILMPVFRHPFDKPLTDSSHRFAMTKLLKSKNIEVSDVEILRKKTSYSIDTLNTLKKIYPKDDFLWVIGKDQVKDFKKWKGWREIKEKFGLIVVPRSAIDISSTEIRKRVKEGKSISKMVPKKIENYIIENKLYK